MPEFILDKGDKQSAKRFAALDSFTQGYIEAMFFTSTGTGDDAENGLEDAHVGELAESAWESIAADCAKFQDDNAGDLAAYYWEHDSEQAGRDFWYTRNGHGVGFWCRDASKDGIGCSRATLDKLTEACREWRELNLCRGDDGLIYLEG